MSCFICASNVLVECFGLKPCWVGDSGMCAVIRLSMNRSVTSKAVLSSVMGLYDVTCVGSLLGLRMVIMVPCSLVFGKVGCRGRSLDIR